MTVGKEFKLENISIHVLPPRFESTKELVKDFKKFTVPEGYTLLNLDFSEAEMRTWSQIERDK